MKVFSAESYPDNCFVSCSDRRPLDFDGIVDDIEIKSYGDWEKYNGKEKGKCPRRGKGKRKNKDKGKQCGNGKQKGKGKGKGKGKYN